MPSRFPRTALILLAFIAIVVIGSLFALRRAERPVSVSTTHATRRNLTSYVSSNGKVEPIQPYVLQSQLTTSIESVRVQQGEKVRRGQILVTLDSKDFESELSRAKGDLLAAEDEQRVAAEGGPEEDRAQIESDLSKTDSEIERLQRDVETLERLYARQAATRQEVDEAKASLDRARADKRLLQQKRDALRTRSRVEAERAALRADEARHSITALQEKINSARVTAPVDGVVYSLPVRSGAFVRTGDVLAEMADLKRIRVRAFVDEPELGSLREGQVVEMTWEGLPGAMWMGEVEQLPNTIVARGSRNVGEVLCSVAAANSELLPNTNVDVRIRTAERPNSLTVPRSAVRTDANTHYVFVVEGGRLHRRDITVGISDSTNYEVLSGISESDLIALSGNSELRDGMSVTAS